MTIAPNQDFVLATVPRQEAGTAAGILGTSQRIGTAVGIAIIGTVLFGSLKFVPGPHAVASAFSHSAQLALLANLGFMIVALILVLALAAPDPRARGPLATLGDRGLLRRAEVRLCTASYATGGTAGLPDRLAGVAAGDLGDELVDRVLVR